MRDDERQIVTYFLDRVSVDDLIVSLVQPRAAPLPDDVVVLQPRERCAGSEPM